LTAAPIRELPSLFQISAARLFLLDGNALAANHVVAFLGRFAGDRFRRSRNDVAHRESGKRQRYDDLFHCNLPVVFPGEFQDGPPE
jgi:hypothetical protein